MNSAHPLRIVPREEILSKNTQTCVEQYVSAFWPRSETAIENVDTRLELLEIDDIQMPVTVNDRQFASSYVCSPYTALVPYAAQELRNLDSQVQRQLIKCCLPILGYYLKHNNVNRNVQINNWLLSTNLYPRNLTHNQLLRLTSFTLKSFPTHSIIFRSLNEYTNSTLLENLTALGYLLVPSRQIYICPEDSIEATKKKDYVRDRKFLEQTSYTLVKQADLQQPDIARIVELYRKLYVDKYSHYNPKFTYSYIESALNNPCFEFFGFRDQEGSLDAIVGQFSMDEITTTPILGYDTDKPKEFGLYRLATIAAQVNVQKRSKIYHRSAGAAAFKRFRGAQPHLEYSAIYIEHLPKNVQSMWKTLARILDNHVVPMIKRRKL